MQAGSTLESTVPKARSRSREVETLDKAPRISLRVLSKLPSSALSSLSSVITVLARVSACPSATATFARTSAFSLTPSKRGTTSQGTRRGAVIRCLTLRQQVVATARRRRCRNRVNRTRNDPCSHARKQ